MVVAYTFAERQKSRNILALRSLKAKYKTPKREELKLRQLAELDYLGFLDDLARAGGALFAVATDGALARRSEIEFHRTLQAQKVRDNAPRMIYEEGRIAITSLAFEIDSLSPQLYVQLQCQVVLLKHVIQRAVLYHVQRNPRTLRRFVWRIDQKNTEKTTFEKAFEKVAPGLLQSASLDSPMVMLEGADYSHFEPFRFSVKEYPDYLVRELGRAPEETTNIGKLLREDMLFPDSRNDESVQIADLLAAGIRRCLRGGFSNNRSAAKMLGRLMVQNIKPEFSIAFVHFVSGDVNPDKCASDAAILMKRSAQPMLASA